MDDSAQYRGRAIREQEREWRIQRIGWAVMALVVLGGLTGILGNSGLAASARKQAADGTIRVEYARLERHHAPGDLTVRVAPEAAEAGEVRLWLDERYVRTMGLESIRPEPESTELEADRIVYTFAVGDASGPLTIEFAYRHDGFWRQRGEVGLVDGPSLAFSQFVFP